MRRALSLAVGLALLASACSGGSEETAPSTAAPRADAGTHRCTRPNYGVSADHRRPQPSGHYGAAATNHLYANDNLTPADNGGTHTLRGRRR